MLAALPDLDGGDETASLPGIVDAGLALVEIGQGGGDGERGLGRHPGGGGDPAFVRRPGREGVCVVPLLVVYRHRD